MEENKLAEMKKLANALKNAMKTASKKELFAIEIELEGKIIDCLRGEKEFADIYEFWEISARFYFQADEILKIIKAAQKESFEAGLELLTEWSYGGNVNIQKEFEKIKAREKTVQEKINSFYENFKNYAEQRKKSLQKLFDSPLISDMNARRAEQNAVNCYFLFDGLAANFFKPEAKAEKKKSRLMRCAEKILNYFQTKNEGVCGIEETAEKIKKIQSLAAEEMDIIRDRIDAEIETFKKSL